jgi:hypothetical protein
MQWRGKDQRAGVIGAQRGQTIRASWNRGLVAHGPESIHGGGPEEQLELPTSLAGAYEIGAIEVEDLKGAQRDLIGMG